MARGSLMSLIESIMGEGVSLVSLSFDSRD